MLAGALHLEFWPRWHVVTYWVLVRWPCEGMADAEESGTGAVHLRQRPGRRSRPEPSHWRKHFSPPVELFAGVSARVECFVASHLHGSGPQTPPPLTPTRLQPVFASAFQQRLHQCADRCVGAAAVWEELLSWRARQRDMTAHIVLHVGCVFFLPSTGFARLLCAMACSGGNAVTQPKSLDAKPHTPAAVRRSSMKQLNRGEFSLEILL
jgi:hypothetical protein